jgi:hypothetical protein
MRKITEVEFFSITQKVPFDLPRADAVQNPHKFIANYLLKRQSALESQNRGLLKFYTTHNREDFC